MTKQLIAIWAEDEQGLIGRNDRLPWHLPKELKHFKETTMGQVLVMGRVTFEGMNRRILPGRQTIVLTRDLSYEADGVIVLHSKEEVLSWFAQQDKTLYIVGGASLYKSFLPEVNGLIQTIVHGVFEGDTYFPDYDKGAFVAVSETYFDKDDKNPYDFSVTTYERKVE
ncbi:dihydrofolate reductase [Streptococcus hyovaginalis]|uniref:dihydrofolate reductase n=1 Tax=Streptococcus hyovaginalis TaxID=149015 RepID=UPI002A91E6B6|nr:dihydrofolate reductase [Streptococcus hyovaginalis]MDY5974249.1 dihydrofolate reductase [Streptococcus hyovaginalis]